MEELPVWATGLTDSKKAAFVVEKRRLCCAVSEELMTGVGYGFEYTPEMAEVLLEMPLSTDFSLLSDRGVEFFQRPFFNPRQRFGVIGEKLSGVEGWYPQGWEPTCVPWAIANGSKAFRYELSPVFLADLLNDATGVSTLGWGMTDDETEDEFNNNKHSGFETAAIFKSIDEMDYPGIIKQGIDNNNFILESMRGLYAGESDEVSLHQIAVVGYDTTYTGIMDVQVVDSNYGMLYLPVEYLYQARKGSLMVVGLKENRDRVDASRRFSLAFA